jgi:hypothetical protein
MRRLSTEYPFTCVTCEAEIAGQAVFHAGHAFCCSGCAAGGPYTCSYDEEAPDHHPNQRHDDPPASSAGRSHEARLASGRSVVEPAFPSLTAIRPPGDRVEVTAPAGRRVVTVLLVE